MNRILAAVVVLLLILIVVRFAGRGRTSRIPVGQQAPPVQAAGWLQGAAPTPDDLKGRVVVLDAFGFWCGPCVAAAPELVETYQRFAPQGVVFLGITPDGEADLPEIQRFLSETKITWPVGYGADPTLVSYGVEYFPTVIVIGGDGRIAWSSDERGTLPEAIDRALRAAGTAVGQVSP